MSDRELKPDLGADRKSNLEQNMHHGGHDELIDDTFQAENDDEGGGAYGTDRSDLSDDDVELDDLNDVYLVIEGRRLAASRAVLCLASPVFKAMFDGFRSDKKEVELHGKKFSDFKEFYRCIDPRIMENVTDQTVYTILPSADEYRVESLMKKCRVIISGLVDDSLGAEGLYRHLHLAVNHDLNDLETKCIALCSELKLPDMVRWMDHYNIPATVQVKVRDCALRRHEIEEEDTRVIIKLFDDPDITTRSTSKKLKTEMSIPFESLLRKELCRNHFKAVFGPASLGKAYPKPVTNTEFNNSTTSVGLVSTTVASSKSGFGTFTFGSSPGLTTNNSGGLVSTTTASSKSGFGAPGFGSSTGLTTNSSGGLFGTTVSSSKSGVGTSIFGSSTGLTTNSSGGSFGTTVSSSKSGVGTSIFGSSTGLTTNSSGGSFGTTVSSSLFGSTYGVSSTDQSDRTLNVYKENNASFPGEDMKDKDEKTADTKALQCAETKTLHGMKPTDAESKNTDDDEEVANLPGKETSTMSNQNTVTLSKVSVINKEPRDILKVLQGMRLLYKYLPTEKTLKIAVVQYIRNHTESFTPKEKEIYDLLPTQTKLDVKGRMVKEIPDKPF